MITADGWLDWAIKAPGPVSKTNHGTINAPRGIVLHSAVGYEQAMWRVLNDVSPPLISRVSWHFSNLKDGRFYQHYPITAQCWHASVLNDQWWGCEQEGGPEGPNVSEPLTQLQIDNAVRLIEELRPLLPDIPRRPINSTEVDFTLWEHKERVRLGGSPTACPSNRIPWDTILELLEGEMETENERLRRLCVATLLQPSTQFVVLGQDPTPEGAWIVDIRTGFHTDESLHMRLRPVLQYP